MNAEESSNKKNNASLAVIIKRYDIPVEYLYIRSTSIVTVIVQITPAECCFAFDFNLTKPVFI